MHVHRGAVIGRSGALQRLGGARREIIGFAARPCHQLPAGEDRPPGSVGHVRRPSGGRGRGSAPVARYAGPDDRRDHERRHEHRGAD
jgi:hypothetical protein